jgi:hypothetical protein
MTLLAAENSRSNLVWNVFDQNSVAQQSLAKAFPTSATSVWIPNTGGNWNAASDWANSTVPNTAGAEADFFGAIGAAHSVYSDSPITAGTLNFNNPNTYVLDGAGSLKLQAATGSAQVIVQQGTQEIDLPTTIAGNTIFNIATGATLIIANPLTVNAGITLTQTGGGTVTYESTVNVQTGGSIVFGNSTVAGTLNLLGDATASTAQQVGDAPALLQLDSLSIAGSTNNWTGRLDITNDDLIVHNGDLADIDNQIKQGLWNSSSGIVASNGMAIGAIQNNINGAPFYGSGAAYGTIDGFSPSPTDIIVKQTIFGDADLNGKVDAADYALIDNGYNSHGSVGGWINGDFNYDGVINGDDYTLIDNAFNTQADATVTAKAIADAATQILADTIIPKRVPQPSAAIPTAQINSAPPSLFSNPNIAGETSTNSLADNVLGLYSPT